MEHVKAGVHTLKRLVKFNNNVNVMAFGIKGNCIMMLISVCVDLVAVSGMFEFMY